MCWQRGPPFRNLVTASRRKASGHIWRGTSVPADAYLQLEVPKYPRSLGVGKARKEDDAQTSSDLQGEKRSWVLHLLYRSWGLGGAFSCAVKGCPRAALRTGAGRGSIYQDLTSCLLFVLLSLGFSQEHPTFVPAVGWGSVPCHLWWLSLEAANG